MTDKAVAGDLQGCSCNCFFGRMAKNTRITSYQKGAPPGAPFIAIFILRQALMKLLLC